MEIKELIKKYGLEKPFKIKDENKKYAVLVKNPETDRINVIKFGAVGYRHNYSKKANKSFRARHRCDTVKSLRRDKPKYWACEFLWRKDKW
jgi:hypothetical protein